MQKQRKRKDAKPLLTMDLWQVLDSELFAICVSTVHLLDPWNTRLHINVTQHRNRKPLEELDADLQNDKGHITAKNCCIISCTNIKRWKNRRLVNASVAEPISWRSYRKFNASLVLQVVNEKNLKFVSLPIFLQFFPLKRWTAIRKISSCQKIEYRYTYTESKIKLKC